MSIAGLVLFCTVYFLAVATPGPGIAAVIARSLAHGTRGAVPFIAGFLLGDLIWFAAAAAGFAALAKTGYVVFAIIKYAGAAYLLYLAYRLWRTPLPSITEGAPVPTQRPLQLFLGSLALTLGNPKTMMFFIALLPTVVDLASLEWLGFVELAVAICVVLPLVLGGYVVLAARARAVFRSPRAIRNMHRGTGAAMAAAAAVVATR